MTKRLGILIEVGGLWIVVSGPAFDLACGAPGSVPPRVLSDLGASKTCPPTPQRFGPDLSSSTTTTMTAPQGSVTVAQVAQAFQSAVRNGTAAGAGAIPDVLVTCGPLGASVTPGSYLSCDLNSATVGGAGAILQMTDPSASDYNVINIGSADLCTGQTTSAIQAWNAWNESQGLPTC